MSEVVIQIHVAAASSDEKAGVVSTDYQSDARSAGEKGMREGPARAGQVSL